MSSTQRKIRKYEEQANQKLQELFCDYVVKTTEDEEPNNLLFEAYQYAWSIECKKINNKSRGLVKIRIEAFAEMKQKHFKTFLKELKPKKTLLQNFLSIFKK